MNDQQHVATWDEVEEIGFNKGMDKARDTMLRMAERLGAPLTQLVEWQKIESLDALSETIEGWMKAKG